jgi:hypothetical protein
MSSISAMTRRRLPAKPISSLALGSDVHRLMQPIIE